MFSGLSIKHTVTDSEGIKKKSERGHRCYISEYLYSCEKMRSFFFFLELVIKKRLWLFERRNVISKSVYVLCSHSQFFFFSAFRESSLCFFCSFSFSSWDSQRIISWLLHDCNHRSSVLDVISFIERVCVFFFFFFILNLFLRVPNIATVSEIAFKRSVCVCVCVCLQAWRRAFGPHTLLL